MPYVPIFLGMPYVIRVNSLTVRDTISLKCLCGGGPWTIAPHWLHSRYEELEYLRWIFDGMKCPRCGAIGGLTWQTFRAEPPKG